MVSRFIISQEEAVASIIFISYLCHITSFLPIIPIIIGIGIGGTAGSKPGLLLRVKVSCPVLYQNLYVNPFFNLLMIPFLFQHKHIYPASKTVNRQNFHKPLLL